MFDDAGFVSGVVRLAPAPALHLREGRAGIFVPAPIVPVDPAVRVGHPGELRERVGHGAELLFALSQLGFRPLGVVDIDADPDPALHLSVVGADKSAADHEPSPFPARGADAAFPLEAVSLADRLAPGLDRGVPLVGMDGLAPAFVEQVIERQAGVGEEPLVDVGDVRLGVALEHQSGDRVGELQTAEPLGLGVGGALLGHDLGSDVLDLVDDVAHRSVRPEDRGVDRGPPSLLEPAVRIVDVVLLDRHHVRPPRLQHALKRRRQIRDAGCFRILGVVGEDVEQPAADDILLARIRDIVAGPVGRDHHVVRRLQDERGLRQRLKHRPVVDLGSILGPGPKGTA
jgi:hypothetical protein